MVSAVEQVGKGMEVGTRVKVVASVVVYNHPEHRNEAFDMKGQEGELIGMANEYQGKPISANFPYLVKFGKKHRLHLGEDEIEAV